MSLKLLFLFSLFFTTISSLPPSFHPGTNRIVGGNATSIEEIPYIASLHYGGTHSCGCIILNSWFVLTAAHCTDNTRPFQLLIRFGSSYHAQHGVVRSVREIRQHPKYSWRTIDFDFSILRVSSEIPIDNLTIKAIQLPEVNEVFKDGLMMVVSGWGLTHNPAEPRNRLRKVEVPIFNQEKCKKAYFNINLVTERMICAGWEEGGRDSCQGDSGGPMVYNRKSIDGNITPILVGVTSWGLGCAQPNFPGVYARVPYVVEWIKTTAQ